MLDLMLLRYVSCRPARIKQKRARERTAFVSNLLLFLLRFPTRISGRSSQTIEVYCRRGRWNSLGTQKPLYYYYVTRNYGVINLKGYLLTTETEEDEAEASDAQNRADRDQS